MSFILDALKKSESERQQQGSAEFAQVPVSRESARPPLWLWVLGALLAINLVVLAGVLLRPAQDRLPVAATETSGFAEQIEMAMQEAPPDTRPAATIAAQPEPTPTIVAETTAPAVQAAEPEPVPVAASLPASKAAETPRGLPDVDQLRASGELPVGELRLDIHVYSDVAADRFVFINMVKHREGSTTSDGLSVNQITPDGVVLDYRGRQFLLPRQ
ncbi:MAG: general secretion pathway protein GspB [Woeseiaceae bacterium]|nr:general secretion pathway protein GspB [Woeseiaceae bacterium]